MAMHWIGAGANLFEGGDLTQTDALGRKLLSDPAVHGAGGIANQFGDHPMQPRNPHAPSCQPHWPFVAGAGNPQQLQAWVAGPNSAGDALVIVSNLGPDEHPLKGTFRTECSGSHALSISFAELGLGDEAQYTVSVVWDGRAAALAPGGAGERLPSAGELTAGEVSAELGPVSHFPRVNTDSACKYTLALPRPTAARTAGLALQRHHCCSHCQLVLLF